jgi:hypothetical protein
VRLKLVERVQLPLQPVSTCPAESNHPNGRRTWSLAPASATQPSRPAGAIVAASASQERDPPAWLRCPAGVLRLPGNATAPPSRKVTIAWSRLARTRSRCSVLSQLDTWCPNILTPSGVRSPLLAATFGAPSGTRAYPARRLRMRAQRRRPRAWAVGLPTSRLRQRPGRVVSGLVGWSGSFKIIGTDLPLPLVTVTFEVRTGQPCTFTSVLEVGVGVTVMVSSRRAGRERPGWAGLPARAR